MLERVSVGHHLVVGASAVGAAALAAFGIIGEPDLPERFDAKQVLVVPAGGEALRIREVIDQDFGSEERRGHQRFIPIDFGVPTDVRASSPTAPDDVNVQRFSGEVRIRIGDPDVTITGQHRYELSFTLPEARLSTGRLALDIIGTEEEFETGRFEVLVAGFDLENPVCSTGRAGAVGGCELVDDGEVYRTVIEPLEPGRGITIGGDIVGLREVTVPPVPPLPERRPEPNRAPVALGVLLLGFGSAAGVFAHSTRRGRNEVFAGGAADAAFGSLPPPAAGPDSDMRDLAGDAPTRLVTDRRLGDLATIEFAPPAGLEPWEAAVLLSERIDDSTVGAWFSGLAGREVLVLEKVGSGDQSLKMSWGPRRADLDEAGTAILDGLLGSTGSIVLKDYSPSFSSAWSSVRKLQDQRIAASGWWKHQTPQSGLGAGCSAWVVLIVLLMAAVWAGSIVLAFLGLLSTPWLAMVFGAFVTAVVARMAYSSLRPARSAPGSALALRAESFRRFLAASEGQHVQWAWERGVLREYSAWAVALGAARAWSRALAASNVPPAVASDLTAPLLVHSMSTTLSSATTAPSESSSGGGGGGGFSGGSVGGGGGGGRSGSW